MIDVERPEGVIVQFGGQTPLQLAAGLQEAGVPLLGTPVESIDLAEDRDRFGALLDELGLEAPPYGIAHDRASEALEVGAPRSASRCSCARRTCSAGARWSSATREDDLAAYLERTDGGRERHARSSSTASSRTRSSSTSTRSATARTSTSPAIMQHVEEAGVHSGDSACVLPPLSLGDEMLERGRAADARRSRCGSASSG